MPSTDGPEAARATPQPATTAPSTAGIESKRGETLPHGTLLFSGPKHGLPPEFGRYRVQKLLGGGGMGAVYLVVNTELEREEALKVPHFEAADDPQVRERFLREAKAAAGLDHPNLCPVYDVGVRDGVYYLTMRYLKGKLLSEYGGTA
jgi:serine/threonine protein kinase